MGLLAWDTGCGLRGGLVEEAEERVFLVSRKRLAPVEGGGLGWLSGCRLWGWLVE
jgi:hypothetical protein